MGKYQELRNEVRAFCPDLITEPCKGEEQQNAFRRIRERMDALYREDPALSAMQLRRSYYGIVCEEAVPKIFLNSPFYFALGVNGGWFSGPSGWFQGNLQEKVLKENVPSEAWERFCRRRGSWFMLCCGPYVDAMHHLPAYTKIFKCGISGIWREVREELRQCTDPEERFFLETAAEGLEAVRSLQLKFHDEALKLLRRHDLTDEQRKFMEMAADGSGRVPWESPRTFFEGLNLFAFIREVFGILDSLKVFSLGWPDGMLYGLYQADLAAGRITPEEAYDLLCRFMVISDSHYDGNRTVTAYADHELEQPLTIGGCDGEGKAVFNDLTRMILRGHRENDLVYPKLHCRISKDSPAEFYDEIARDVWNGRCVHTLFNDDVIIPGFIRQGYTPDNARRYLCCGCWDGVVDGSGNPDMANYYSMARVLEASIYQDPEQSEKYSFPFEALDDARSPEDFRDRVCRNLTGFLRSMLADYTAYGKLYALISPHPAYSATLDGCIGKRKDDTLGGADFNQRMIVLAFLANVTDSILAVQRICFDRKICSVREFLDAVRRNWEGAEELRQEVMRGSYWGDDSSASRELGKYLIDQIMASVEELKNERGGKYLFSLWIYREFRYWGEKMRALPDGRRDGDPLSQALNPSDFRNHEEITTTINALSCLDYSKLASSNLNLSFGREHVTAEILSAVFKSFIEKKLHLLQPNCFSKKDLEDAMVNPEDHHGLIVKVCGFSARFVALEPQWQKVILNRYQY